MKNFLIITSLTICINALTTSFLFLQRSEDLVKNQQLVNGLRDHAENIYKEGLREGGKNCLSI